MKPEKEMEVFFLTIGSIIRDRRLELNMTQEDLANAVGATKATVSRWESGDIHKMKRSMIAALSRVLRLDPMLFLQQEEVLLPDEVDVIHAYRAADDGVKAAVRKLLDVHDGEKTLVATVI